MEFHDAQAHFDEHFDEDDKFFLEPAHYPEEQKDTKLNSPLLSDHQMTSSSILPTAQPQIRPHNHLPNNQQMTTPPMFPPGNMQQFQGYHLSNNQQIGAPPFYSPGNMYSCNVGPSQPIQHVHPALFSTGTMPNFLNYHKFPNNQHVIAPLTPFPPNYSSQTGTCPTCNRHGYLPTEASGPIPYGPQNLPNQIPGMPHSCPSYFTPQNNYQYHAPLNSTAKHMGDIARPAYSVEPEPSDFSARRPSKNRAQDPALVSALETPTYKINTLSNEISQPIWDRNCKMELETTYGRDFIKSRRKLD